MATRADLLPFAAEFPASNYPALLTFNARPALAFDQTTSETCYWTFIAPQGLTTPVTAVISLAISVTSGTVCFDVALEAITALDALNLNTSTSFGTVNTSANTTVPGTAYYLFQISVTLTNNDSIAAADYVRLSLARNVATDNAAADALVLGVEFRDAA